MDFSAVYWSLGSVLMFLLITLSQAHWALLQNALPSLHVPTARQDTTLTFVSLQCSYSFLCLSPWLRCISVTEISGSYLYIQKYRYIH